LSYFCATAQSVSISVNCSTSYFWAFSDAGSDSGPREKNKNEKQRDLQEVGEVERVWIAMCRTAHLFSLQVDVIPGHTVVLNYRLEVKRKAIKNPKS
jgi:hypothetical protein